MKNTIDFMNAVKANTGAVSDYALAKSLDTSRQVICGYMSGRYVMSNENALKVASILNVDPYIVLAAVEAERSKTALEKTAWTTLFERLGGMAAALVVGVGLTATPAPADAYSGSVSHNNVYYVKSRRRKPTQINPLQAIINQLLCAA